MTQLNWQPIVTPDDAKLAAEVEKVLGTVDDMARGMASSGLAVFRWLWDEDGPFTPQQRADRLGVINFLMLWNLWGTVKALANQRVPGVVPDDVVAPCDGIQMDGDNPVVNANGGPVLLFTLTVRAPVGAAVTVNGQTLTATDGTATFAGLSDGTYAIQAACDGFTDGGASVELHRNTTATCGLVPVQPPPTQE